MAERAKVRIIGSFEHSLQVVANYLQKYIDIEKRNQPTKISTPDTQVVEVREMQ